MPGVRTAMLAPGSCCVQGCLLFSWPWLASVCCIYGRPVASLSFLLATCMHSLGVKAQIPGWYVSGWRMELHESTQGFHWRLAPPRGIGGLTALSSCILLLEPLQENGLNDWEHSRRWDIWYVIYFMCNISILLLPRKPVSRRESVYPGVQRR